VRISNCKNIHFNFIKLVFFLVSILTFISCSPVKKLRNGELSEGVYQGREYLLEKNFIVDKTNSLDKAVIETFFRQQPNRKLFRVFYFHTWLYNQVNQEKMLKKKEKRNIRFSRINEARKRKVTDKNNKRDKKTDLVNAKRKLKGKKTLPYKRKLEPKLKNLDEPTFGEKIMEIGEAPVILDTFMSNASVKQIAKYCQNNGFFKAKVRDSVVLEPIKRGKKKIKRAHVYYFIEPGLPYKIRNISYKMDDAELAQYVYNDSISCKILSGQPFQSDVITLERERIYKNLLNNGYYEFAQDFIYFLVDSSVGNKKIDLTIGIKNFTYKAEQDGKDTIMTRNHIRYFISHIYTITDFNPYKKTSYNDTAVSTRAGLNYHFLYNGELNFRPGVLTNLITVFPGSSYSFANAEETYKRLSDLRAFKNINVVFERVTGSYNKLNMIIQMAPVMRQSYSAETELTNTANNYGIGGSLVYQNRNTFKGAELMEIKLKGGLTAQKTFGSQDNSSFNPVQVDRFFNTILFGPEFDLYFPRAFFPWPFNHIKFKPSAAPKTVLTSSGNYQERPEFARTIINFSFGYQWKFKSYNFFYLTPFETNIVNVTRTSAAFQQALNNSNDFFLRNSFNNHITNVTRLTYFFNNQSKPRARNFFYFKSTFESAGNLLRPFFKYVLNQTPNQNDSYTIGEIPFAQFIRIENDFRYYKLIGKNSRVVFRFFGGLGYPFKNLKVLPYEKGFFAGGPNSVRAWKARSLGPGGFSPASGEFNFDKIGDNQIEINIEYRFPIYKIFNGAFFVDAGNVFLRKPDPLKPRAEFKINDFYTHLGIGTGAGLRLDLSFFIIRLDVAFRVHDPAIAPEDAWQFNIRQSEFNFGIGYPF
jgi:hypothetical protein